MRIHKPDDFKTTPWRNGGGTTTELRISPAMATVQDPFHWRLSTAMVATSGPFSKFEGYDRTLLLLEGAGMDLDHGSEGHVRLDRSFAPHVFSGDWETSGTLLQGPCRDFNVITHRADWGHEVWMMGGGGVVDAHPGSVILIYVVQGVCQIVGTTLTLPTGHLFETHEATAPMELAALEPNALAIGVRIWPRRHL